MQQSSLLINDTTIKQLITMEETVAIIDCVFKEFAEDKVINPGKVTLDMGEMGGWPFHEAFLNAMPAYLGSVQVAGQKFVGGFAGERAKAGLPFITAMIMLVDARMGNFISVMDGTRISNLRTGAQAAVALKYMLNKPKISMGMFGAGQQARQVTHAISTVFEIEELRVWNIHQDSAEKFKADMQKYVSTEIKVCKNGEEACQADAVFTLTPSKVALIKEEWVKKGTIVFPMGSYQEIEYDLIHQSDAIVVDHVSQALNRGILKPLYKAGKIAEEDITASLAELSKGPSNKINPEKQRIICIPIGIGATDVAVAYEVYQRALAADLGTRFDFTA
ncbi:ornithine cyclodeaminase family protein [Facklamia miroungae]|uniref:Ornithine cyclodeaminase/alanine dehydrogenase n=1 Tax=Facklamia miroungae TaxID=120956 RepID=A0A1G7PEC2_9LACT|nr:ornithine cyclodeaminase family protein [Facklamia miroungae]NKZ28679.1 ornithine cyclodeaminase family protein [Facklamia miroungae]SDF84534.1 ornithine cyclodeaminase/alanine dehydrogenase [Facklamia miroungae]